MKFEIKARWSTSVLFSLETESLKLCLEAAIKQRADLGGADLYGADLRGANLYGANLGEKKTIGERPLLQIGPLGSRADMLVAWMTDKGVWLRTGCFWGSIEDFEKALADTHGTDTNFYKEYSEALVLIKGHALRWAPVKVEEKRSVAAT